MRYEHARGGFTHSYEPHRSGITYECGTKTRLEIPWDRVTTLRGTPRGDSVMIGVRGGTGLRLWLAHRHYEAFFESFFSNWARHDRAAALKCAFDYAGDTRRSARLWIGLSVAFPLLLSAILLSDGIHTALCTRALLTRGATAVGKVAAVKKNRRGNLVWSLTFDTGAQIVRGKREVLPDQAEAGGAPWIAYDPEHPASCWDLTKEQGASHLRLAQRKFSAMMTLTFGSVFVLLGAVGILVGMRRAREKRPGQPAARRFLDRQGL